MFVSQLADVQEHLLLHSALTHFQQQALQLASATNPMLAQQIAQDVIQTNGGAAPAVGMGGVAPHLTQTDNISGTPEKEHAVVTKARQQSNDAAQPNSDGAVNTKR